MGSSTTATITTISPPSSSSSEAEKLLAGWCLPPKEKDRLQRSCKEESKLSGGAQSRTAEEVRASDRFGRQGYGELQILHPAPPKTEQPADVQHQERHFRERP